MEDAPRNKVQVLQRSAHDWDLVRELAPSIAPSAQLILYC
jgi:hypothetical protein